MPEQASMTFAVACSGCSRDLLTTTRIGDPEIVTLEAHLRTCRQSESLGSTPPLGEIMRRIRVAVASPASS